MLGPPIRSSNPAVPWLQGTVEAFKLREYTSYDQGFIRDTMLTLVGGSVLLTHLAEEHDSVGLGSGTTLLIAISILLRGQPARLRTCALNRVPVPSFHDTEAEILSSSHIKEASYPEADATMASMGI